MKWGRIQNKDWPCLRQQSPEYFWTSYDFCLLGSNPKLPCKNVWRSPIVASILLPWIDKDDKYPYSSMHWRLRLDHGFYSRLLNRVVYTVVVSLVNSNNLESMLGDGINYFDIARFPLFFVQISEVPLTYIYRPYFGCQPNFQAKLVGIVPYLLELYFLCVHYTNVRYP